MHHHMPWTGDLLKNRRRRTRIRWAERIVANSCRLYLTRPRQAYDADELLGIAKSVLQLSLVFLLDAWRLVGRATFVGFGQLRLISRL